MMGEGLVFFSFASTSAPIPRFDSPRTSQSPCHPLQIPEAFSSLQGLEGLSPVTSLEATLTHPPTSVASKELTEYLSLGYATLTKSAVDTAADPLDHPLSVSQEPPAANHFRSIS